MYRDNFSLMSEVDRIDVAIVAETARVDGILRSVLRTWWNRVRGRVIYIGVSGCGTELYSSKMLMELEEARESCQKLLMSGPTI